MSGSMGRRTYLKRCVSYASVSSIVQHSACDISADQSFPDTGYRIFFGDLHNHNSVGYGLGSVERAFDIARNHLDFVCVTPHAYGDYDVTDDMIDDIDAGRMKRPYIKITKDRWTDVCALVKDYHKPGEFVTFPGYERHSSVFGDYTTLFPFDDAPLNYYRDLDDFIKHIRDQGAMTWQHHPAYPEGSSGAVPKFWNSDVTPVLEIFSEHGNAESDTAPEDYFRHSNRGRVTSQTMQAFLAAGYRFGVIASTDDHLGFPGAYGEGKAAVLSPDLTREGIFDAIRNRRTYGVSGDRIIVDFRVNGNMMGTAIPYVKKRTIACSITGWDWIDRVELVKNNRVIYREFPADDVYEGSIWSEQMLLRIEYGWGPMATNQTPLDRPRPVYDWDIDVMLESGRMESYDACFQSGPIEENRRHVISNVTDRGMRISSYTSRRRAFKQRDTNSVVMRVTGKPDSVVHLQTGSFENGDVRVLLHELVRGDSNIIGRGSVKLHRLVPYRNAHVSFVIEDGGDGDTIDWYYVRVFQKNGQLAWSSPVWVEKLR